VRARGGPSLAAGAGGGSHSWACVRRGGASQLGRGRADSTAGHSGDRRLTSLVWARLGARRCRDGVGISVRNRFL
jgi:hypothetical protein